MTLSTSSVHKNNPNDPGVLAESSNAPATLLYGVARPYADEVSSYGLSRDTSAAFLFPRLSDNVSSNHSLLFTVAIAIFHSLGKDTAITSHPIESSLFLITASAKSGHIEKFICSQDRYRSSATSDLLSFPYLRVSRYGKISTNENSFHRIDLSVNLSPLTSLNKNLRVVGDIRFFNKHQDLQVGNDPFRLKCQSLFIEAAIPILDMASDISLNRGRIIKDNSES